MGCRNRWSDLCPGGFGCLQASRILTSRRIAGDNLSSVQDPTWYYAVGSDAVGPVSQADLLRLVGRGEISINTYVYEEGMEDWATLKEAMSDYLPEELTETPSPPAPPATSAPQTSTPGQTTRPSPEPAAKPAADSAASGLVECAKCRQMFSPGMMVDKNGFKICALCNRLGPVR